MRFFVRRRKYYKYFMCHTQQEIKPFKPFLIKLPNEASCNILGGRFHILLIIN